MRTVCDINEKADVKFEIKSVAKINGRKYRFYNFGGVW